MKSYTYAVIQTGKRTWQVAEFTTLDNYAPIFTLRSAKYKSEANAITEIVGLQSRYDDCNCKVVHELQVNEVGSSPKRFHTLVDILAAGQSEGFPNA